MALNLESFIPALIAFTMFAAIIGVGIYVYAALALMTVAKRLGDKQPWLAWIPVANLVLMARLAKMHWWPVLLLLSLLIVWIPVIGQALYIISIVTLSVFGVIWLWKICEARKRPGWWAILIIIPLFGSIWMLILLGILAWSKE